VLKVSPLSKESAEVVCVRDVQATLFEQFFCRTSLRTHVKPADTFEKFKLLSIIQSGGIPALNP
jgi:hypothetical protein